MGRYVKMGRCAQDFGSKIKTIAFAIFSLNMFLTYFLHLNSYLLSFLPNTISRAQLLCFFLLSLLL